MNITSHELKLFLDMIGVEMHELDEMAPRMRESVIRNAEAYYAAKDL